MPKIYRLFDRSRVTTDWTCHYKRFLQYELDGKGIVSNETSLEFFTGTLVHDALAEIATKTLSGEPIDISSIAKTAYQQLYTVLQEVSTSYGDRDFAKEQATLLQGLILGFYKHVWPRLLKEFPEILFVELETEYDHENQQVEGPTTQEVADQAPEGESGRSVLLFMAKPDLVLRDPASGTVVYFEYKTTSSKKEEWVNSWDTAVQVHSTARAVKATTGLTVDHVVVQGLYKGWESYGKQSSPFCYAYLGSSGNPPFSKKHISYEYKPGLRRTPVWELEGGIEKWVSGMPEPVLTDQFPRTPPLFINQGLVGEFFDQRMIREREIETTLYLLKQYEGKEGYQDYKKYLMDATFPKTFSACQPGWGKGCEYRVICHGSVPDPLKAGFSYREPHHEKEALQFQEKEPNEQEN